MISTTRQGAEYSYSTRFSNAKLPPSADSYVHVKRVANTEPEVVVKRVFVKGEIVYATTYAGPIVKITVTGTYEYGVVGILDEADAHRLWMAGTPIYPVGYIVRIQEYTIATQEKYLKEEKTKYDVRIIKKNRVKTKNNTTNK